MGEMSYLGLFLAVGGAAVSLLLGPVGQAFARRISGAHRDPKTGLTTGEMTAERIAEVEGRVAELEAVHGRMLDLEERLDFAERLLTRGREAADQGASTPT